MTVSEGDTARICVELTGEVDRTVQFSIQSVEVFNINSAVAGKSYANRTNDCISFETLQVKTIFHSMSLERFLRKSKMSCSALI